MVSRSGFRVNADLRLIQSVAAIFHNPSGLASRCPAEGIHPIILEIRTTVLHEWNGNHRAVPAKGGLDSTPKMPVSPISALPEGLSRLERNHLLLMTPKKQCRVLSFWTNHNPFCVGPWLSEKKIPRRKLKASKRSAQKNQGCKCREEGRVRGQSSPKVRSSYPLPVTFVNNKDKVAESDC
jgi:hypothetical protein